MARKERGKGIRNSVGLIFYLCGGWRSYQDIAREFGWVVSKDSHCKTASRNVRALEAVGLPIEWMNPPDQSGRSLTCQRMRLPQDWVARTSWLRRYIIRKEPVNVPAYTRSPHK